MISHRMVQLCSAAGQRLAWLNCTAGIPDPSHVRTADVHCSRNLDKLNSRNLSGQHRRVAFIRVLPSATRYDEILVGTVLGNIDEIVF